MATKAYLMINMEKRFSDDGYYVEALRELATIPEVETVEPVSGIFLACHLESCIDRYDRMSRSHHRGLYFYLLHL